MKYATLILGLAILLASVAVAAAKDIDRKCYRDIREAGFTVADSEWICDRALQVKPHETGWHCEPQDGALRYYRAKGGAKRKRDAPCVVE